MEVPKVEGVEKIGMGCGGCRGCRFCKSSGGACCGIRY